MPTISGRARPIEKFAEAAAKCSIEVGFFHRSLKRQCTPCCASCTCCFSSPNPKFYFSGRSSLRSGTPGHIIRQMHPSRLPVNIPGHVRKGIYAIKGLLSCKLSIPTMMRHGAEGDLISMSHHALSHLPFRKVI